MEEGFIPQPDYAICPSCKEKVDLPKKVSFRFRSEKKKFNCPNCGSTIEYIEGARFSYGAPHSLE